ncbi:hypothetical protein QBC37DRAFT_407840 [Rhypophila decipiens]|uniref:Uncharacterized protein n=1 Tax=Rhypophila decipiens TaxID=261697 RepID=A0AAN7BBU8_9PEZI|nr:hypothetical protein QBC37DRAFT_407840 [Rhypophila decipiens]
MSSSRRNSLTPPSPVKAEKEDPGAHELDATSDSEDHFSDAQSGPPVSHPASPIPRLRVERVDDKPAYGEVPGTKAYSMREEDAKPDEIAFVPEPDSKLSSESEEPSRTTTPGGQPIPKTVVEETPDSPTAVTHPETAEQQKQHRADPPPDIIVKADGHKVENGGEADTPMSATSLKTPVSPRLRRKSSTGALRRSPLSPSFPSNFSAADGDDGGGDDDDGGDDFDDFEEGEEDAAFDDFGDDFQQSEQIEPAPVAAPPPPQPQQPALSFPIPSFDDVDPSEIYSITEPYLSALFPPVDDLPDPLPLPPPSRETNPIFLTPRSASLWSQLVAPPPLQPPDWIRSRIRRLFLVSLGVPVDLDEILPASKQKKLVLPSLLHRVSSTGSLRNSNDGGTETGGGGTPRSLSRVRQSGHNASSTSVDSQGNLKPSKSRDKKTTSSSSSGTTSGGAAGKKGQQPEPYLDLTSAKQLCMTTDEALSGMTDQELQNHVKKLEDMQGLAHEMLVYWQKRTDEKIGDREAFEGVIENLVKHARKTRK